MTLIEKAKLVGTNSALRSAYARWAWSKMVLRRPPKLRLSDKVALGSWACFSEYWSFDRGVPLEERAWLKSTLQRSTNPIAFDVGANIGAFTCLLPELGAAEVHAFEPSPDTFSRLDANVQANGLSSKCHLNCLAVGSENTLVTFRLDARASPTNRLFVREHMTVGAARLQTVACIQLDHYCAKMGIQQIDLLKIDVEGMEPSVLRGAMGLLEQRRIRAILIEICPANLRSVGLAPSNLYNEIEAARYSPYSLNQDGTIGARLSLADIEATTLSNAALLPND